MLLRDKHEKAGHQLASIALRVATLACEFAPVSGDDL